MDLPPVPVPGMTLSSRSPVLVLGTSPSMGSPVPVLGTTPSVVTLLVQCQVLLVLYLILLLMSMFLPVCTCYCNYYYICEYKTHKFECFTNTPVTLPISSPGTTHSSGPPVPVLNMLPSSGPPAPLLGMTPSVGNPPGPVLGTSGPSSPISISEYVTGFLLIIYICV